MLTFDPKLFLLQHVCTCSARHCPMGSGDLIVSQAESLLTRVSCSNHTDTTDRLGRLNEALHFMQNIKKNPLSFLGNRNRWIKDVFHKILFEIYQLCTRARLANSKQTNIMLHINHYYVNSRLLSYSISKHEFKLNNATFQIKSFI